MSKNSRLKKSGATQNNGKVNETLANTPHIVPETSDHQIVEAMPEAREGLSPEKSAPSEVVLEAHGVKKSYGAVEVLHGIDVSLAAGERVALIGPNGAGKTTLLQCLAGWQPMDEGEVMVCGASLTREEQEARASMVLLPDTPNFYQSLTAWEHMLMVGRFHDLVNVEEASKYLLNALGLWTVRKNYPATYSRGMKYKLGLALGLLINPKVILLDEPTAALDPLSAIVLWQMLDDFEKDDGGAVLLSSHQVELTTPGIDRFFMLLNGHKIGDDTPQNWVRRYNLPSTATVANVFTAVIEAFTREHPEAIDGDVENR